ncbi:hypothetical protein BH11ACT7_BH11ACT7_36060 [soil metagenome]
MIPREGRPGDTITEAALGLPAEEDSPSLPAELPVDTINRALPPWALTALRTGVQRKHPDARKVWGRFVSIAMSAHRRRWTETQFVEEVWSQETRIYSGGERIYGYWPLMIQLLTSVKGSKHRANRQVVRAWATAGDNLLREGVLKTTEDFMAEVIEAAYAWDDRLDEGSDNLSVTQKLVMHYVTTSVEKRENSRVTCPCREVGAVVGIPHRTANYTLRTLAARGFLLLHDRGTHSADPKSWKAAIYSLSDPSSLPYGGVNQPPAPCT